MEEGGPGGREGGVMSNLKCKEDEVHMSNLVISLLARQPRVFVTWSEHHHPPPLKLWFRACVHNALLNYSSFPLACECVKLHALLIATYYALTTLFLRMRNFIYIDHSYFRHYNPPPPPFLRVISVFAFCCFFVHSISLQFLVLSLVCPLLPFLL